jgi:hypothetical protein
VTAGSGRRPASPDDGLAAINQQKRSTGNAPNQARWEWTTAYWTGLLSRDARAHRLQAVGVLHASANIFETLAKLVFNSPNVKNQTLASLFDGYRKRSELPELLLDYVQETYKRRNIEPLAGHGATKPPTVSAKDAAVLVEMTKMCVRLERRLAGQEIDAATAVSGGTGSAKSAPVRQEHRIRPPPCGPSQQLR